MESINKIQRCHISLGGNLGSPRQILEQAINDMSKLVGMSFVKCSSFYKTQPVNAKGPDYINCVACYDVTLSPEVLLNKLQILESNAGRIRLYRNAPRTLDLDILLFGQKIVETKSLTIPHPRMWDRAFVLIPLNEIYPGLVSKSQLQLVSCQQIEKLSE